MAQLTECVVDILRRCGPGVLPARKLRAELLHRRPAIALDPQKLRRLAERSGNRLQLLEVHLDPLHNRRSTALVEGWVILTASEDAPDSSPLAASLWRSLSALAAEVDTTSRIDLCRWAIKAEEARRLTAPDRVPVNG